MLPITIDAARVAIVLVGNGAAARRRLALLDEAGATRLAVYAPAPSPALAAAAGARLHRRLPTAAQIAGAHLVFVAAVDEPATAQLRRIADGAGVLLNVEDDVARSDFHSPAVVRRGDLAVAISTGGRSPGLAAALRRRVEKSFAPEWGMWLEQIAALRERWRAGGLDGAAIVRLTAQWFEGCGASRATRRRARRGGSAVSAPPAGAPPARPRR